MIGFSLFVAFCCFETIVFGQVPNKPQLIPSWQSNSVTISTAVGGVDMNMTGTFFYNEATGTDLNVTTGFFGLQVHRFSFVFFSVFNVSFLFKFDFDPNNKQNKTKLAKKKVQFQRNANFDDRFDNWQFWFCCVEIVVCHIGYTYVNDQCRDAGNRFKSWFDWISLPVTVFNGSTTVLFFFRFSLKNKTNIANIGEWK